MTEQEPTPPTDQSRTSAPKPDDAGRDAPRPRRVPLPLGGEAMMYSRENCTQFFHCGHGELGRLLARKMAPLPVRFDGGIWWYVDECLAAQAQVIRTLERWRRK